jgi:hypothetical protein
MCKKVLLFIIVQIFFYFFNTFFYGNTKNITNTKYPFGNRAFKKEIPCLYPCKCVHVKTYNPSEKKPGLFALLVKNALA